MKIKSSKDNFISQIQKISSENVYEGKKFSVKVDKFRLPDGEVIPKEIVIFPECVAILALLDKNKILLLEQFREPTGQVLLEIPAGRLLPNEEPIHGAVRELEEEAGYKAGKIEEILHFYVAPGYSTEFMHLFIATELQPTAQHLKKGELITKVKIVNLDKAAKMILSRKIIDAKTIIGIQKLLAERPTKA